MALAFHLQIDKDLVRWILTVATGRVSTESRRVGTNLSRVCAPSVHYVRRASSAAWARPIHTLTMPVFLFVAGSRNSPSFTKPVTAATAPFCWEVVGLIKETGPRPALRNKVGSGMIRLV